MIFRPTGSKYILHKATVHLFNINTLLLLHTAGTLGEILYTYKTTDDCTLTYD